MKMAIKMFSYIMGLIWYLWSNFAKFWFSKPFFNAKYQPNLYESFFHWRIQTLEFNFYYSNILKTLIFDVFYFIKMSPNFDDWYRIKLNHYKFFMAISIDLCSCVLTLKLGYTQLFKWCHSKSFWATSTHTP